MWAADLHRPCNPRDTSWRPCSLRSPSEQIVPDRRRLVKHGSGIFLPPGQASLQEKRGHSEDVPAAVVASILASSTTATLSAKHRTAGSCRHCATPRHETE
jgi:hypothetical protein